MKIKQLIPVRVMSSVLLFRPGLEKAIPGIDLQGADVQTTELLGR